jgi:DNA-binding MarR family transcriptional regulator
MPEGTGEPDAVDAIIEAWRRERPDLPLEATAVVSRIWHLARVLGEVRRATLADASIDPAILDLLSTLRRSGAPYRLTTRELAQRSLVTPGAISQRLARAERDGLVTREPATDGSRAVFVSLTGTGITTVNEYVDVVMRRETELLAAIPASELNQLSGLLRHLMLHLRPESSLVQRTQVGHANE